MLNGEHLYVVKQLESLGIQHRCAEGMEDRVKESLLVSRRIRWAPLPWQTQAILIACGLCQLPRMVFLPVATLPD